MEFKVKIINIIEKKYIYYGNKYAQSIIFIVNKYWLT